MMCIVYDLIICVLTVASYNDDVLVHVLSIVSSDI